MHQADFATILPFHLLSEPDSAVILLIYEADPAAILLLAASIYSETPERGLAVYRSAGSIISPFRLLLSIRCSFSSFFAGPLAPTEVTRPLCKNDDIHHT